MYKISCTGLSVCCWNQIRQFIFMRNILISINLINWQQNCSHFFKSPSNRRISKLGNANFRIEILNSLAVQIYSPVKRPCDTIFTNSNWCFSSSYFKSTSWWNFSFSKTIAIIKISLFYKSNFSFCFTNFFCNCNYNSRFFLSYQNQTLVDNIYCTKSGFYLHSLLFKLIPLTLRVSDGFIVVQTERWRVKGWSSTILCNWFRNLSDK